MLTRQQRKALVIPKMKTHLWNVPSSTQFDTDHVVTDARALADPCDDTAIYNRNVCDTNPLDDEFQDIDNELEGLTILSFDSDDQAVDWLAGSSID